MTSATTQQNKTSAHGIGFGATQPSSQISTSNVLVISSDIDKERESVPSVQPSVSTKGKGIFYVATFQGELHNLSQTLTPDFSFDQSLRKKFLDPAINLLFRAMKKELEEKEKTIEDLQRELAGVGFTPNSITGKNLVTKLKDLQDENEELGRQLRQGRVEQYEVEIALQRKLINELRHGLEADYENQFIAFDSEIERLQDLIFQLQSRLKHYENKFGPLLSSNKDNTALDKSKSSVADGEEIKPIDVSSKRDLISQGGDKG
ncbi:16178_t:CDS:2 [Acaulospora colombiana]|uniref:16178_t:CDS:1 n=1 Tax=Acaulospora colombiana TaxID=27376 RepID=A0ACA9M4F6_9GLOM|nr:16178_t:CDS:2 [Acaulospora colombiana]